MVYNLPEKLAIIGLSALQLPSSATIHAPPTPHPLALNYLGATIFISYIVAALILSFCNLGSLLSSYHVFKRSPQSNPARTRRQLLVFSSLALLSFATLSYNMLSFLIHSYLRWREETLLRPTVSFLHASSSSIPTLALSIWRWTTTSTLFLDFARDLCRSNIEYAWTGEALGATMLSSLYMSALGASGGAAAYML